MRGRLKTAVIGVFLPLASALTSCATLGDDIVGHKEEGTSQVYAVDPDQAWRIARAVFVTEGVESLREHRAEGYILASSGPSGFTWGTVMGAWIDKVSDNETKVTVLTRRRITVNIFTTLTESTFHRRFAQGVKIVKTGAPLPALLPPE